MVGSGAVTQPQVTVIKERIFPVPSPLSGRIGDKLDPRVADWLFGDIETGSDCASFAIVDPYAVPGLSEVIQESGLPHQCLYREADRVEILPEDFAPFLVQLDPQSRFTRNLLSWDPKKNFHWHLWSRGCTLFLRSGLSLAELARRLRRWNMIVNEREQMLFLRYWDSSVFEDFVEAHSASGSLALFQDVSAWVIYRPGEALRMSLDGPADSGLIRVTESGRAIYRKLRRDRLERTIAGHFGKLPEFAEMEQAVLMRHVRDSAQIARAAGLGEPEEIFNFSLGLGLPGDNAPVYRLLAQLETAHPPELDGLRKAVMDHLCPRIAAARAAAALRETLA